MSNISRSFQTISGLNISPCLRYWSQCRHDHYTWTNDFKRLLLILSPLESSVTGPELICLGPVGWCQASLGQHVIITGETNNNTLTRHEWGQQLIAQRKRWPQQGLLKGRSNQLRLTIGTWLVISILSWFLSSTWSFGLNKPSNQKS